jgi:hypothetical protein
MAEALLELEGTWEEILEHGPELVGKTVRLTVVEPRSTSPSARLGAALEELARHKPSLRMTSGSDSVRLIREGRAGAMYGYDPYE